MRATTERGSRGGAAGGAPRQWLYSGYRAVTRPDGAADEAAPVSSSFSKDPVTGRHFWEVKLAETPADCCFVCVGAVRTDLDHDAALVLANHYFLMETMEAA